MSMSSSTFISIGLFAFFGANGEMGICVPLPLGNAQ